jgi:hypothetical protein
MYWVLLCRTSSKKHYLNEEYDLTIPKVFSKWANKYEMCMVFKPRHDTVMAIYQWHAYCVKSGGLVHPHMKTMFKRIFQIFRGNNYFF